MDKDSDVVIKVVDSGSGIDPDLAGKIMTPFFSTKEDSKGPGIAHGLAGAFCDRWSQESPEFASPLQASRY